MIFVCQCVARSAYYTCRQLWAYFPVKQNANIHTGWLRLNTKRRFNICFLQQVNQSSLWLQCMSSPWSDQSTVANIFIVVACFCLGLFSKCCLFGLALKIIIMPSHQKKQKKSQALFNFNLLESWWLVWELRVEIRIWYLVQICNRKLSQAYLGMFLQQM